VSTARELIGMNIYRYMVRDWMLPQVFFIVGELIMLFISYIGITPREVVLPAVDIPPLTFSQIFLTLFSASISVNGIILGFSSVVVIFFRRWLDDQIYYSIEEKIEKTYSKDKKN